MRPKKKNITLQLTITILLSSFLCLQCNQKPNFVKSVFKDADRYNPELPSLILLLKPWDCFRCFYMFCPFLNEAVSQFRSKKINLLIVFAQTRKKEALSLWKLYGCANSKTKMPPWVISQKSYSTFFKDYCNGEHIDISHFALFDKTGQLVMENDLRHMLTVEELQSKIRELAAKN